MSNDRSQLTEIQQRRARRRAEKQRVAELEARVDELNTQMASILKLLKEQGKA